MNDNYLFDPIKHKHIYNILKTIYKNKNVYISFELLVQLILISLNVKIENYHSLSFKIKKFIITNKDILFKTKKGKGFTLIKK